MVANYDEVAQLAGIPVLKQDTSQSASVGFASKVAPGFSMTIYGYVTKVKEKVETAKKAKAIDDFASWFSDFKKLCKIALSSKPQMRGKLGWKE